MDNFVYLSRKAYLKDNFLFRELLRSPLLKILWIPRCFQAINNRLPTHTHIGDQLLLKYVIQSLFKLLPLTLPQTISSPSGLKQIHNVKLLLLAKIRFRLNLQHLINSNLS